MIRSCRIPPRENGERNFHGGKGVEKSEASEASSNVSSTLGGKARATKRIESVSTMPGVRQILGSGSGRELRRNAIFPGCTLCFPVVSTMNFLVKAGYEDTERPRRSILRSRNGSHSSGTVNFDDRSTIDRHPPLPRQRLRISSGHLFSILLEFAAE